MKEKEIMPAIDLEKGEPIFIEIVEKNADWRASLRKLPTLWKDGVPHVHRPAVEDFITKTFL